MFNFIKTIVPNALLTYFEVPVPLAEGGPESAKSVVSRQTARSAGKSRKLKKRVSGRNVGTPRIGKSKNFVRDERTKSAFKRNIKRNGKYRNMRPFVDDIAADCANTERCITCQHRITENGKSILTAIDHFHDTESDMSVCSYRGVLCQHCNTTEGQALVESQKTGDDHAEIWARKILGGSPTPITKNILVSRMKDHLKKGKSTDPLKKKITF